MIEWHPDTVGPMTWEDAVKYCESLGDGWRLPKRWELVKALEEKTEGFRAPFYWTASIYAHRPNYAWLANFNGGLDYYNDKSNGYYVRAVRGE